MRMLYFPNNEAIHGNDYDSYLDLYGKLYPVVGLLCT